MSDARNTSNNKAPLLTRFFPFLRWIGEWRSGIVVRADVIAGISVGMILIPQAMAYAQLAGLPAYYGLYAAFITPAIAALFGSSRHLATGPVAMASLITAATLSGLAVPGSSTYITLAIVLAIMVGIIRFLFGVFRLGVLVNFLSHPVIIGFTNAAALIIATTQLDKLFGVTSVESGSIHLITVTRVIHAAFTTPHWPTLLMACGSLALLVILRLIVPRLPYVLITVIIATLIGYFIGYTGECVGEITPGLPAFSIPEFSWSVIPKLIVGAFTITLIGLMEVMSIAKAIAVKTRQRFDVNQELIGQGLANIVGGFFQSYPISGSIARSAVNYTSGAKTGMASVISSCVVAAALLFLTPLLSIVPIATLAAIIIVAIITLIRLRPISYAWRTHPHNGIVAIVTCVVTLVSAPHLYIGIITGIALSLSFFLFRMMRPHICLLSRHPDGTLRDAATYDLPLCRHIALIRFDGQLYFGNCSYFEDKVLEIVAQMPELKCVILDAGGINRIDASGVHMLRTVMDQLRELEIPLYFTRVKTNVMDAFNRTGLTQRIGHDHIFRWNQHALDAVWSTIVCDHQNECPLSYSGNTLFDS